MKKEYRNFEDAREFVRKLKLDSIKEWKEYCKSGNKPDDIPTSVPFVYEQEWKGFPDWLGNDSSFLKFEEARKFIHTLGLKNFLGWREYCKSGNRPKNIPVNPNTIYLEWKGFPDWLGTKNFGTKNRNFRTFDEVRAFVIKLKLKSMKEWKEYVKSGNKPDDIPKDPRITYYQEWGGPKYFLGLTENKSKQKTLMQNFENARKLVHSLNLKKQEEWNEYCKSGKKPDDIPSAPFMMYKGKGWKGFPDWLGYSGRSRPNYLSYNDAKKFVRALQLQTTKNWENYCKLGNRPDDIPSSPHRTYKNNGWTSWGDWLGSNNISKRNFRKNYLPFDEARKEARKIAKKYDLKNYRDWMKAKREKKIPKNIPGNPWIIYEKSNRRFK
jgi:hypothetical protein